MKNTFTSIAVLFLLTVISSTAHADLDGFLDDLDLRAHADKNGFHATLSHQFGKPVREIQAISDRVTRPADAFMALQLGKFTNQSPEKVFRMYEKNRGKGWGAMAKELGIKPGSAEFHALKSGNFHYGNKQGKNSSKKKKKNKGKGNGKGKGKKDKKDKK